MGAMAPWSRTLAMSSGERNARIALAGARLAAPGLSWQAAQRCAKSAAPSGMAVAGCARAPPAPEVRPQTASIAAKVL